MFWAGTGRHRVVAEEGGRWPIFTGYVDRDREVPRLLGLVAASSEITQI